MSQKKLLHVTVGTKHHDRYTGVANVYSSDLVYSSDVTTPDMKQNHPHYIGLSEHAFKY